MSKRTVDERPGFAGALGGLGGLGGHVGAPQPTIAFATLGCRLNQVDTQELQGTLEARGFHTLPSP